MERSFVFKDLIVFIDQAWGLVVFFQILPSEIFTLPLLLGVNLSFHSGLLRIGFRKEIGSCPSGNETVSRPISSGENGVSPWWLRSYFLHWSRDFSRGIIFCPNNFFNFFWRSSLENKTLIIPFPESNSPKMGFSRLANKADSRCPSTKFFVPHAHYSQIDLWNSYGCRQLTQTKKLPTSPSERKWQNKKECISYGLWFWFQNHRMIPDKIQK